MFERMVLASLWLVITTGSSATALAQAGVSSFSMGAFRGGVSLRSEEFRIEELINYHRHLLPLPVDDERVRLDARFATLDSGKTVLQIGLATAREIDIETAKPLNLVLVIDRSGSMSGDRIAQVKQALLAFVERLRKKDSVSIVSFSNSARVELPASRKTNQSQITKAIQNIRADGSTNLHAGLMLGYQEAIKHFDIEKSNRVILLTDGIANVGVTDEQQIARDSKRFNKEGIDLTTIGLGQSLNHQLLRELADAGRGMIHFVGDSADIEKSFVDEIDSLLSLAARKVKLTIDCGKLATPPKVYGYRPRVDGSKLTFQLDNLNCGATQIVLLEFAGRSPANVTVKLSYVDPIANRRRSQTKQIDFSEQAFTNHRTAKPVRTDLQKNYAIARVAHSLQQSAELCERNDFRNAEKKLAKGIRYARNYFPIGCDENVDRVVKIAKTQQNQLLDYSSLVDRR